MKKLDDLLISRIRKVTMTALAESKLKDGLWATVDRDGTWILACSTYVIAWPRHLVDNDSTKLDKLIRDGLEEKRLARFEENSWLDTLVETPKLIRATLSPIRTAIGAIIEYQNPWSKKATTNKVYYRPDYIDLASEISESSDLRYAVYPAHRDSVIPELTKLVIYDGRSPFMILSNSVPEDETEYAEEDARTTAG